MIYFILMLKLFKKWIGLKEKIDAHKHEPPFVSQGDIWWAHIGENIGSEMNGKSDQFSRPVIIFKKLSHGFYFIIPTTTQQKTGTWFVPFRQKGKNMIACLHQARAIDHRRLTTKLGTLDDKDAESIKKAFSNLYLTE